MADGGEGPVGPPVVGLPPSFDRHLRLGPFPSVRDALKFATYAAVGAVPAALMAPAWWIPFLGGGFLLSVYRPDGRSPDEQARDFLAYRWRRGSRRGSGSPVRRGAFRGTTAPVGPGSLVAVVEAEGVPVSFLPPDEARSLFDRFRELLRNLDAGLFVVMGTSPLEAAPFRPAPALCPLAPTARDGYDEMVRLLCQRRRRRRVRLAAWVRSGDGSAARLERAIWALREGLGTMGVPSERLADDTLATALDEIGWGGGRPS